MDTPTGWENTLDQNEVIIWQGRPDATVFWYWPQKASLLLGGFLVIFALIWMKIAAQDGGQSWMFGLIILAVAVGLMIGIPYGKPYQWSKTWYLLTNTRALICTDLPMLGRKVKSYPITAQSHLELESKYKSNVYFATRTHRTNHGTTSQIGIGFVRIDDAEIVFDLAREIQKEAT